MRKDFIVSGRLFVLLTLVMALTSGVFAQEKLRDAMDLDGDDIADFTVFRPSNNVWYTSRSSGGFTFQQFGLSGSDYVAPGDFDGDGKGDIAVWRDTNGGWYWLNSSDSTFNAIGFGISGDEPVGRDYDGDGKTDLAVIRRTGGNMIWYVLGTTAGFYSQQFGFNTDFAAPGDYDGDGKFDFAIQRPGATSGDQATFYIQRSGDGGFTIQQWGFSSDLVVPGDYDGDGKTDIAVVREGQPNYEQYLIWYIQRSSDMGLTAQIFGLVDSDLNTQNDYDGDGKTDLAIWRDTDSSFYIYRSSDQVLSVAQWGQLDDYPVASYDTH
ncbi:MAG: VCBS repeat-containing protein [Pyrinomonadaceae bacterium]|nr:VCBS repeat-containing protein [Pyrinomonadaceae bacterium]